MSTVAQSKIAVNVHPVVPEELIDVRYRCARRSLSDHLRAARVVSLNNVFGFVEPTKEAKDLLVQRMCADVLAVGMRPHPLPPHGAKQFLRPPQSFRDLASLSIYSRRRGAVPTVQCHPRCSLDRQESEFPFVSLDAGRQCEDHFLSTVHMSERLDVRQARGSSIGRALPILQSGVRGLRLRVVMGQEFRFPLRNLRKMGCEFMGDLSVNFPPSRFQHRSKGRVAYQRMFENVT